MLKNLIIFIIVCFPVFATGQTKKMNKLVTVKWLSENLKTEKLVILHYGKKEDFVKEHIPTARMVSLKELIVDKENGFRHELPDDNKIESVIRSWGINNDSKIVICYGDEKTMMVATRLYFTLDYAGLGGQTAILNGGFVEWKNENHKVTSTITEYEPGNFKITANSNILADKEWILNNLDNPGVALVDARPEAQYSGEAEDHNSKRKGHIQGAVNIPFGNLIREDKPFMFKNKSDLLKLFEDNFINENSTIVTYCGSGMYAAPVYFITGYLGYNVKLYDASFEEWGNDETLPIIGPVSINPN